MVTLKPRILNTGIILLCSTLAVLFAVLQGPYPVDDTFIHLRIVKNFILHGQLVYNLNEPTFTSSAPAWNIVLGVIGKVTGVHDNSTFLPFARTITALLTVLAAVLLLGYSHLKTKVVVGLASAFYLLDPYTSSTISCAMEQSLFMVCILSSLVLLELDRAKGEIGFLILAGFCLMVAFFSRIETIVVLFVVVLNMLKKKELTKSLILVGSFALFTVPLLCICRIYYGSYLPVAFFVKTTDQRGHVPFTDFVTMKELLRLFGQVYVIPIMTIVAVSLAFERKKLIENVKMHDVSIAISILMFLAYLGFLKEKGISSRYLMNFSPFIWIVIAATIASLENTKLRRGTAIALMVFLLALNLISIPIRVERGRRLEIPDIEIGKWINQHTPPESVILSGRLGYVGFYSDRKVYDLGLVSRPRESVVTGVLHRSGRLDVYGKIDEYKIDYIVGGRELSESVRRDVGLGWVFAAQAGGNGQPRGVYRLARDR